MGVQTDALENKRTWLKMFGWPPLLLGGAGFLMVGVVVLLAVLSPFMRRRDPFDTGDSVFSIDLMRDSSAIPKLAVFGIFCAVLAGLGVWLLRSARDITLELRATDAEASRRMRVEERMRERR
jgi:hypothetical protein